MNIKALISKVRAVASEWGEEFEPPATENELLEFINKTGKKLNVSLPQGYLSFLREVNGLEFNGLIIYGTKNSDTDPDSSPLDLLEMNEVIANGNDLSVLVIGEDSTGLLTYHNETNIFQYRDRIALDRVDSFESFEEMLNIELNKVL